MVIPEHMRSKTELVGPCHTEAEIKAGIVKLVEMSDLQCVPLRHVTCRFGANAAKIKLNIKDILNSMEAEGLIGMRRMQALSRTYVFSAFAWQDLMESEAKEGVDWEKYSDALRDYK